MKDFDFSEFFCEIVSGLVPMVLLLIGIHFKGIIDFFEIMSQYEVNVGIVTIFIVFAYIIGLVIDAIGLSLGEKFLDEWIASRSAPTYSEINRFSIKAPERIFIYREKQWAFYSLYRNLFITLSVFTILMWIFLFKEFSMCTKIVLTIVSFVINMSLAYASRVLINLYYKITSTNYTGT